MSYDCSCDYDAPKFYCQEMRKARKRHTCEECRCSILPGEVYEYVSGLWEDVNQCKTCLGCVDIRQWTKNNVPCLCWSHGNTIEDCRGAVQEAYYRAPEETVGLRFGFLRRVALRDKVNKEKRTP